MSKHVYTVQHTRHGNNGRDEARQYIFEEESVAKQQCDLLAKMFKEEGYSIGVDEEQEAPHVLFAFKAELECNSGTFTEVVTLQKREVHTSARLHPCRWYGFKFSRSYYLP